MTKAIIFSDQKPGCARCGAHLKMTEFQCPKCGQTVDWSDVWPGSGRWYRVQYTWRRRKFEHLCTEYHQAYNARYVKDRFAGDPAVHNVEVRLVR